MDSNLDRRACREVSLGMEVLKPPVGELASADCMTDGRAERTGERELDDFRHAAMPLPLCYRAYVE